MILATWIILTITTFGAIALFIQNYVAMVVLIILEGVMTFIILSMFWYVPNKDTVDMRVVRANVGRNLKYDLLFFSSFYTVLHDIFEMI